MAKRCYDSGAHPQTSERVTWTGTFNSPTDDPELTGAVMRGIVRDAEMLKAAAGISARGRKLKNRIAHFVISWEAGRSVSPEHVETVCRGLMKKLKVEDHVAVAVMHDDTEHPHVHVLICTVNPDHGPRREVLPRRQGLAELCRAVRTGGRAHRRPGTSEDRSSA